MPLRLIEPNTTKRVEAAGAVFHLKNLTNGERIAIATRIAKLRGTDVDYTEFLACLADMIDSIEGHEDANITDVLNRIEDLNDFKETQSMLLDHIGLSKAEAKNSASSLGQNLAEPTGITATSATPETASSSQTQLSESTQTDQP